MRLVLRWPTGLALAAALLALHAVGAETPLPAEVPAAAFFEAEAMSEPVLSPEGDGLAILLRNKSGRRVLAVLDTSDLHKITLVAAFGDADVVDVHWVNDKRIIFRNWREDSSAVDQRGSGLYAVDRDGSAMRELIMPQWPRLVAAAKGAGSRSLTPDHVLLRTLNDGSDDVLIKQGIFRHRETEAYAPMRLDTRSGEVHSVLTAHPPEHAFGWLFDAQAHLLAVETLYQGEQALFTPTDEGWQERSRFPAYASIPGGFDIQQLGADGRIYVTRYDHGEAALFLLDPTTFRPAAQPVVAVDGFDFNGHLIEDSRHGRVLGVRFVSDAEGTVWLDPELKSLQDKIDARLHGLINIVDLADCGCANRVLVTSYSDRQPPLYFLYDRTDQSLVSIGASRPAIQAAKMARTDFYRIRSRDGQQIPLYVTRPSGKGPWPTVVLVHGGPFLRGWSGAWDPESQFLASRGYLVVKPEFRGSAGYGIKLYESGFKQWGLAAQDDIADATVWAAAQGLADRGRTCIAGASYGGYATLMGLVRYPDLYRCGVAWAAVADIDMMYDIWWSDASDEWKGYGMPVMVGDKVKDAAQFAATSPLKLASHIQRPLLLAHGGIDARVPIAHAYALRDALQAAHAPVTWIEYPEEAHGWYEPTTRIGFYEQMEKFLAANLAADANVPRH